MSFRSAYLAIGAAAMLLSAPARAQQPQQPVAVMPDRPQAPGGNAQGGRQRRPLTELEERERRIRAFDPTVPRNPLDEDRFEDVGDATPDRPAVPPASRPGPTPGSPSRRSSDQPVPGSIAESQQREVNPRNPGPQVADDQDRPTSEYTGPGVLTRAYTLQRPQLPQQLRWRYSLGIQQAYDSGTRTLAIAPAPVSRYAQQYNWSFGGRQYWRRDILGINYNGSWNQTQAQNLTGSNHSLIADYTHVITRRLRFHNTINASSTTQGFSLQNPVTTPTNSLANVNISASPATQLFDTITRQLQFGPSLQIVKSARLSFNLGGGLFFVQREAAGLTGLTGYQAQADVNYRLTSRKTTGAYFQTTIYNYAGRVAESFSRTFGLVYSQAIDRSTQVRLRGGVTLFENRGLSQVIIPPEIARYLGTSVGIIDSYRSNKFSELSAEVIRDFHRSRSATVSYTRSLAPGNGVILASVQQAAGAGFNIRLFRRYLVSTGVGWTSLSSSVQTASKYGTEYAFLGVSREVAKNVQATFRFDFRRFVISAAPATPDQLRVAFGLNWSPGEGPLRLW